MNNHYLAITTLFLLFPLAIFSMKQNKNNYEKILAFLLVINIVISHLFWLKPIQKSWLHFYDGFFGKISHVLFSIYILFIKKLSRILKLLFLFILASSFYTFYLSNSNSSSRWGSDKHVFYHILFHMLISIGAAFAFL